MKIKSKFNRLNDENRLYKLNVPVIGLTGGIASGKSTVTAILKQKGLPVIDADHLVKEIYTLPETLDFIKKNFPDVIKDGGIQFPILRQKVFSNSDVKSKIEGFIYQRLPMVFKLAFEKLHQPSMVIYDVPLLFEKNLEHLFDLTVLIYAPQSTQRQRLMARDNHTEEIANNILNQQMDMESKRSKAEFIIDNTRTQSELTEEVNNFLRQIMEN
jgi:dephospho-CoA kinase